jgi:hypothetical protein
MGTHEPLGQQNVERKPGYLSGSVPEDALRPLIEQDDTLPLVHRNDGVIGKVEDFG